MTIGFSAHRRPATRSRAKAATERNGGYVALGRNEITPRQRERILELVRRGRTYRSIERETGHRRETISRYANEAGLIDVGRRRDG